MAVGLAAAPPGVGAIGRELVVYWREAAVGHDALAYYLGKTLSLVYETPRTPPALSRALSSQLFVFKHDASPLQKAPRPPA